MGRRKNRKISYSDIRNNKYEPVIFKKDIPSSKNESDFSNSDVEEYENYGKDLTIYEYVDRRNIIKNIKQYYIGYENDDEWKLNDADYGLRYEGISYDYYGAYCKESKHCNRKCNCEDEHKIDKYHKYDEETDKWMHIKRLPDIKAHITCAILNKNYFDIEAEKHYILDNKFYWKYVFTYKNEWVIKFYPNLHDNIQYLMDKVKIKLDNGYNKCIKDDEIYNLFYLFNQLPKDIQDEIMKYF